MTQQTINIGTIPNDSTGDPIRESFNKTNLNFDEIYATGVVDGSLLIGENADLNEITTSDADANITITANGAGIIILNTDTITISTTRTPANDYGSAGDTAGDICWDTGNIYVCIADYVDNVTPIWKKSALIAF